MCGEAAPIGEEGIEVQFPATWRDGTATQGQRSFFRHCEKRSDEAIQCASEAALDCFAALAMTDWISA